MSDEFDKNPQFKTGSEVLQALFENGKSPLSEQFLRWKIWARWPEFVGPSLAKECEPVGYFQGTLYIWVPNSSSLHHLNFLKDQIQKQINTKLEKNFVQKIRLTLDRKEVPTEASERNEIRGYVLNTRNK